jgi:hypothetical protein
MATIYKIHPAIGVARLGNSEQYYIGPEAGGALPTDPVTGQPVTSFRDADGNVLKQAARFRVYAYDSTNPGDPGTEVKAGSGGVTGIAWTVYLANKKSCWYQFEQLTGSGMEGDAGYLANGPSLNPLRNAGIQDPAQRQALILDPGPRTVGAGHPATAELTLPPGTPTLDPQKIEPSAISTLGSLLLDAAGDLLVLGGEGSSGTTNLAPKPRDGKPPLYEYVLTTYANNDGWFDDVADGPVTASLVLEDGTTVPVDVPAWCLSVPPAYAPQIVNMVTLYDSMLDVFIRTMGYAPDIYSNGAFNPDYLVDYPTEVAPILARPNLYRWVADIPPRGTTQHVAVTQDRTSPGSFPFYILRSPENKNTAGLMPKLAGDNPITNDTISKYLTLTATQYFLIQQWASGKVRRPHQPGALPGPGELVDRGVLDNCVGGAFCPGIEMTWINRNTTIYAEPFRLRQAVLNGPLSTTNGNDNNYVNGLEPGDVTKYMAQPWQADFNECSTQPVVDNPASNTTGGDSVNFWWWPAQRPWAVYPQAQSTVQLAWTRGFANDPDNATIRNPNVGDMQMVVNWKDLGFILQTQETPPLFVEIERLDQPILHYQPPLIKPPMPPTPPTPPRPRPRGTA